jgi:adenylate cyclase
MSRLSKAVILGLFIGIVGQGVGLAPFVLDLEENIALDLLFNLRGTRQAPPEVVVVSIDKESAQHLNLPNDPRKWPRSHHARLIENLIKQGAAVIAFDLIFDETKSAEEDQLFSEVIRKADNVVLCEYIKREKIPLSGKGGSQAGSLDIEKLVAPIPPLAKAAVALAPFPLPKIPIRVNQYWTFKTEAGDTPTLPVVVFQVFAMGVYDEFIHLLEKVSPSQAKKLPYDKEIIITSRNIENVIREIRSLFEEEPLLGEKMLKELENSKLPSVDFKKTQILKSLIKMYQSAKSRFLNFYGPPGTIITVSYYHILELQEKTLSEQKQFDFSGKAVFIGLSERSLPEQRDGFYTVFSQSSGLDLSGVEIAATAFANLIEEKPLQPISFWAHLIVLFLWGMVIGIVCYYLPTLIAVVAALGLSVAYFFFSEYQFMTTGSWYPLVLPLLIQSPLAFFSAVGWKSIDINRERRHIKKALEYYLPVKAVEQVMKNLGDFKASKQLVYGICLYTDAEKYTSLSETISPEELSNFMNNYYEALFKPIKQHGGVVTHIAGDSILAIWVKESLDSALGIQACQAALEIAKAVDQFNQSSDKLKLPTRVGLHSGNIMLGSMGAMDHYEYHPIGDIVNTSERIQGLNKYLGTRILVSEEVIGQLGGFLTRELGKFLLVGKTKPLSIHELLCRMEEVSDLQRKQCAMFAEVLNAFRRRSWEEAMEGFRELIKDLGKDGPSLFYLRLCEQYRENPPEESWDRVVRMTEK